MIKFFSKLLLKSSKCRKAFTLLEMSITILVLGIILVGVINFQIFTTKKSKENITVDRLARIEQAIREYFIENEQLPCPSDLLLTQSDTNYGKELRTSGSCVVSSSDFLNTTGTIIYGGVPTQTLGLTDDYAVDAWNNRIAYVIGKGYGDNKIYLTGDSATLTIQDTDGNKITDMAVYVLISGGKNINGVFKDGNQLTVDSLMIDRENAFSTTFDGLFIKDINSNSFDDIVVFKDKESLVFKDDMETLPCTLKDLRELDSDWYYTSYAGCDSNGICDQGTVIESLNACPSGKISKNPDLSKPVRKCLKYGQWSDILFECVESCGESDISSITTDRLPTSGELSACIDLNYLKRAKIGEVIVLQCINNKVGYIKLQCQTDGTWHHIGGDCYDEEYISSAVCQNSELNSNVYNFTFSTTVGTTDAGGVVDGQCSSGYEVQSGGSSTIMATCQADETWSFSGGPCVLPGGICANNVIDNNTVNFTFPNITSGTTANGTSVYNGECITGYSIVSGGSWNIYATCNNGIWVYYGGPCMMDCQNSTLNDNTEHFYYSTTTGTTSVGTSIWGGACDTGYNIDGGSWNMYATCLAGGGWQYNGGPCIESCLNSELNSNPYNYVFSYSTTYTNSGATLWGDCADGYTHVSGDWTYTASCSQGVWTYSGGTCGFNGCLMSNIGSDLSNINYDLAIWKRCKNFQCKLNQSTEITSVAVDVGAYIIETGCVDGYVLNGGTAVKLYCDSNMHWQYISGTAQCIAQ